ncbi:MAG: VWA domain-containing protein [Pyrinomonadaceae bacterium]|nr:VWA domain-containing protein [Pyrinomonadaceae bacterium]
MTRPIRFIAAIAGLMLITTVLAGAQSRRNVKGADLEGSILSVTAIRSDGKSDPIKVEDLYLYENGIEQKIKNFSYDPSPAKIVLLVDNSQTLPTSIESLKKAAMEFAYEIFEGDQLFTIAFDEKAEIIQEWTDDAKKMEASFATFRKKGNPYLFDALSASVSEVLLPLMPGTRKTAVVIISDGLDRGSKMGFDKILGELQNQNITVYALQIPDRTGGAYRRDQPKPTAIIQQLTEATGGRAFSFDEAQSAAKAICDELRRNRYLLSYIPANTSTYDARKLLLIGEEGVTIRTKSAQPPNIK